MLEGGEAEIDVYCSSGGCAVVVGRIDRERAIWRREMEGIDV